MKRKVNILLTFAVFLLIWKPAHPQLSPGDLSSVHAHLEGTANCTKCHDLGDKVSNEKCLNCHTEIKSRIDKGKGYHYSEAVQGKDCFACHNDHHGRNFQIIRFDPDTFNHRLAGYTLEGKHARIQCSKCHNDDHISDPELGKKNKTYLGLSSACLSCHQDFHQGTLSDPCLTCHDFEQFKPAVKFDHDDTDFPLKGKHQSTDCQLCHKTEIRNGKKLTMYKGIRYNNCTSCHTDVHNNKFGQNCTRCHNQQSFNTIKTAGTIDHSVTDFPLRGKHRTVGCRECHKGKYIDPLPHARCLDCHNDYHEGQIERKGSIVDCSDCHDVSGFSPSLFTFEQHQDTPFPLEGAHAAIPCFMCHKKENTVKWQFQDLGTRCNDCHDNIHEGFIDKSYYPDGSCLKCHKVSRWNDIAFDHALTDYDLRGVHQQQSCRDCHFNPDEEGMTIQQFSSLSPACLNCHQDVHRSQFEEYGPEGCLRCHTYEDWKAGEFDHNTTRFKLDGKHNELACMQCHKKVKESDSVYVLYKIEEFRCEDCH